MRKGFLASLALMVGHTAAQAQYFPAPRPIYPPYPPPNNVPVWMGPPAAVFNPAVAPQQAFPVGNPNFLPRGYFPAVRGLPVVQDGPSTPVPDEPTSTSNSDSSSTPGPMPGPTVEMLAPPLSRLPALSRPVVGHGPANYFDVLPPAAQPPKEPVPFHRDCHEQCFGSVDYLLGWINRGPLHAPLISTGSAFDVNPGALDQPGTVVLFGGGGLDFRMFHGIHADVGTFLDNDNHFSVEVGGFYYLPRHDRFSIASDSAGFPVISRPVFNAIENLENVYLVAAPATDNTPQLAGSSSVDARSQMWGLEANGRWHAYTCGRLHSEVLAGFRTIGLEETLEIRDQTSPATDSSGLTFKSVPIGAGAILLDQDSFRTFNQFYGFQVGGKLRWELDRGFFDVFAKVGMGINDEQVRIDGSSALVSGGTVQTAIGGILALPSNMGEHNRQVFSVVPEVGVNIGFEATTHIRLRAGYSCMFWPNVVRPGAQIDRAVNPSLVPTDQDFASSSGPPRPTFQFHETAFFLQSLNFGIEFHY
jgi:hypothetical protein